MSEQPAFTEAEKRVAQEAAAKATNSEEGLAQLQKDVKALVGMNVVVRVRDLPFAVYKIADL